MSIPAINLGSGISAAPFKTNQLTEIGQAIGNAPAEIGQATLDRQDIGNKLLAPYRQAVKLNPSLAQDPGFVTRTNNIAKAYGVPPIWMVPTVGQQGGDGTQPAQGQTSQPQPQTPQTPTSGGGAPTRVGADRNPNTTMQPMGAQYTNEPAMQAAQQTPTGTSGQQPQQQSATPSGAQGGKAAQAQSAMQMDPGLFLGAQGKTLQDLSYDQQAYINAQASPQEKLAAAQSMGVTSLPPNVLNGGAIYTPAEKMDASTKFATDVSQAMFRGEGPGAIMALAAAARANGVPQAAIDGVVNNPALLNEAMQSFAATLQSKVNKSELTYAQAQQALANASHYKTLSQLETAQANLDVAKTVIIPQEMLIKQQNADSQTKRAQAAASQAATAYLSLQDKVNSTGVHAYQAAVTAANDSVQQIQKSITTLTTMGNSYGAKMGVPVPFSSIPFGTPQPVLDAQGKPVIDPTTGQPKTTTVTLQQKLDELNAQLTQSRTDFEALKQNAPTVNVQKKLGTAGIKTNNAKPPFQVPAGYNAQQRNGKWGVVDAQGNFYPWQGAK